MIVSDRLRALIADRGITQSALAERVGVSQQTIAKMLSDNPSGSRYIHKVAQVLRTTTEYLTGESDDPSAGYVPPTTADSVAEQLNSVLVPHYYSIEPSMGAGAYFDEHPGSEQVALPKEWLRSRISGRFDQVILLTGRGDSMKPTIDNGDMLVVDRSQLAVREADRIWAFAYGEMAMVKRLHRNAKGGYRVTSDNSDVAPAFEADDDEIHVVGRVVGIVKWQ